MLKLLPVMTLGILSVTLVTPARADNPDMTKFNECIKTAPANCKVWKEGPNPSEEAYDKCTNTANNSNDASIIREACALACYEAKEEVCPFMPTHPS
jgi:hypothetical protein